jgi:4,5:9,10-diseco-3-hydroxy-5,9,17-trioxoandrosta-1(10),2-diene-4-oate hydrolase
MLPGWGCTAYTFRRNVPALAGAGFRVCVIEPPGQGWSDKPDSSAEYTLPSLARNVATILDRLDITSAPFIGQSLGGAIALQTALDAPERVRRLALWSPIGFGCARAVWAAAMLPVGVAPFLQQAVGPLLVRYALELVYGPGIHPTDDDVRQYAAPISSPGFVRAQIELLRNVRWDPLSPEVRLRLTLPVVILTGTNDPIVPLACLADAAETLPNARLHVVAGAGHASNETHSDEVNRETLAFLRVPDALATG